MAIVELKKIAIVGLKQCKSQVMKLLQDAGCMHIDSVAEKEMPETVTEIKELMLDIEWVMKRVEPFASKRGMLEGPIEVNEKKASSLAESLDYRGLVNSMKDLAKREEVITQDLNMLHGAYTTLLPWINSNVAPRNSMETDEYKAVYLNGPVAYVEVAKRQIGELTNRFDMQIVHHEKVDAYATLVYHKNDERAVREVIAKFQLKDHILPPVMTGVKEALHNISAQIKEEEAELEAVRREVQKVAAYYESLQIIHDHLKWKMELDTTTALLDEGYMTFALTGWVPASAYLGLQADLKDATGNKATMNEIQTDEMQPVEIKNNKWIEPFESVTKLYGLPLATDVDPTAALAIFFISFFGLALTDAGYGIIMFVIMAAALKFVKMSNDMKKMIKLLMYGGVFTFIMGVLYGGWFGMDIAQAPEFLKTIDANGEPVFIGQILNPMKDPISVLAVSLALGYFQVTVGVLIAFYWEFKNGSKKDALLSNGLWAYSLITLAIVIAGSAGLLSPEVALIGKNAFYAGVVLLVLTQGRDKKNIFMKLFSGILSLYNFVGYFGDVLSYSRLLALGLATSIVGMAANIVATLVSDLPYIGWLIMTIVLVVSHLFNLILNALGAFIHSGRLQFVEFFSKFLQGGGRPFAPFKREGKYVFAKDYSNN